MPGARVEVQLEGRCQYPPAGGVTRSRFPKDPLATASPSLYLSLAACVWVFVLLPFALPPLVVYFSSPLRLPSPTPRPHPLSLLFLLFSPQLLLLLLLTFHCLLLLLSSFPLFFSLTPLPLPFDLFRSLSSLVSYSSSSSSSSLWVSPADNVI